MSPFGEAYADVELCMIIDENGAGLYVACDHVAKNRKQLLIPWRQTIPTSKTGYPARAAGFFDRYTSYLRTCGGHIKRRLCISVCLLNLPFLRLTRMTRMIKI